ncbi:S26 family signal peptidase [Paenibacillus pini]
MLGDNRQNSTDSRMIGSIDMSMIIGKVVKIQSSKRK